MDQAYGRVDMLIDNLDHLFMIMVLGLEVIR